MSDLRNNITVQDDALNVDLPKWPCLVVSGTKVSEVQAAEILIRTDLRLPDFKYAGNDQLFNAQLSSLFGVPTECPEGGWGKHSVRRYMLRQAIGVLDLEYLTNSQIVSAYIGGPHGWINWSGNIFCNTFNIGKWPDTETVANDWALIAEAFPYLNLRCHLFNGESCEDDIRPVVEYVVKDGAVLVKQPDGQIAPPTSNIMGDAMSMVLNPGGRERGITVELLASRLKDVLGKIPQYQDMPDDYEVKRKCISETD